MDPGQGQDKAGDSVEYSGRRVLEFLGATGLGQGRSPGGGQAQDKERQAEPFVLPRSVSCFGASTTTPALARK